MFSGCTVLPDNKETELGNSDQEASPSDDENIGMVLVPCREWKCFSTVVSGDVDVSEVARCHFLRQISLQ